MKISLTSFVSDFQDYLAAHPGVAGNEVQRALGTIAGRTFENLKEARRAFTEFKQTVQRSNNPELNAAVQRIFDREIQRLSSASPAEEPAAEQQRREPEKAGTGIQDLDLSPLTHIFSLLDLQSQGRAAQVSRVWHGAMRLHRLYDLSPLLPLYTPEFRSLSSLFGILLPTQPYPSSRDLSTACKTLLAKVPNILGGVKESQVLSDEEKAPFLSINPQDIVQDPKLLFTLLHTAREISLVAPFLNGLNEGPTLDGLTTLAEKAEAVRKYLKENRNRYTQLTCSRLGMLCFPRELCSLQNLQNLYLYGNRLATLPAEIRQLAKLQLLVVSGNQLTSLPPEITHFTQHIDIYFDRRTTSATQKFPKNINIINFKK